MYVVALLLAVVPPLVGLVASLEVQCHCISIISNYFRPSIVTFPDQHNNSMKFVEHNSNTFESQSIAYSNNYEHNVPIASCASCALQFVITSYRKKFQLHGVRELNVFFSRAYYLYEPLFFSHCLMTFSTSRLADAIAAVQNKLCFTAIFVVKKLLE